MESLGWVWVLAMPPDIFCLTWVVLVAWPTSVLFKGDLRIIGTITAMGMIGIVVLFVWIMRQRG